MKKIVAFLDEHFEEALLVIMLILITVVEFLQVVIRNIPWIPALKWAEEFCRFCWIWSVFLSLPYTIKRGSMLRVNVLMDLLPQKARKIINISVDFINAIVMIVLGYYSIGVVDLIKKSGETSPAMEWPMWIIYSVMLLGFFLGAFRAVQQGVLHIRNFKEDQLSTIEQTMKDAEEEAAAGRAAEEGGND